MWPLEKEDIYLQEKKCFYGSSTVSFVNSLKYLGIDFLTMLSSKLAVDDLVSKAKRAFLSTLNKLYKFKDNTIAIFVKVFDVQCGSEIWGLEKNVSIEKVHLFAIKKSFRELADAHQMILYMASLKDFQFT